MIDKSSRTLSWQILLLYFSGLILAWTLRVTLLTSAFENMDNLLLAEILKAIVKIAIWAVPALILIHKYEADVEVSLKRMFTNNINLKKWIIVVPAFVIFNCVSSLINNGSIKVSENFDPLSLIGVVFIAGVTEEIVFRGFIFNGFSKLVSDGKAIVYSSALFTIIHFPSWIYKGYLSNPLEFISRCVSIFALGCVFGWIFSRSKNILPAMFAHILWNFMVCLFYGS